MTLPATQDLNRRIDAAWVNLAELSATATRELWLTPRGAISQSWGPDKVHIGTYTRTVPLEYLRDDVHAALAEVAA